MALQGQHWHETDIAGSVSNVLCWDYNGSGISEPSGQLLTLLCENPNVEFARRNIVSIAFNRKRTLLPITVEWGQDRKQFCALSARARFHTAWTQSGTRHLRSVRA